MAVQWQWKSDGEPWNISELETASWTSYSSEENFLIEQAYQSSLSAPVLIKNYFVIDIQRMIQYMQISPTHQRPIRRLSNYQTIHNVCVRKDRFVFHDNENVFFEPFKMNMKFGSSMIQERHKDFIAKHRENRTVNEKDIVDAAIHGVEQEGLKRTRFKKEASEICDELRQVRNCRNKLDIKKRAVYLYTRNGTLATLINKALRESDKRPYQNTLGPFCYLLYSYLCLREPFDVNSYCGTVYRGASLQPGMIGRYQKEMKQRKGFLTWPGFTSTTKERSVADMFSLNTLFEILLSNQDNFTSQGVDISGLSHIPDEKEVLLPPGFQFEIVGIQELKPTTEKQFLNYLIQLLPRQSDSALIENSGAGVYE